MFESNIDKRANLAKQARELVDLTNKENRTMTGEEIKQYDSLMDEVVKLTDEINREARVTELEKSLSEKINSDKLEMIRGNTGQASQNNNKEFRMGAFRKFLESGLYIMSPEEKRVLSAGVDAEGGYTVVPQEFIAQLLKDVEDAVFIRKLATKRQLTKAASLGIPTLEKGITSATWGSELSAAPEDTSMEFGKREFEPNLCSVLIKISNKLIRNSAIPIEEIVREQLAINLSKLEEEAFMVGNGVGQPLGLFYASNDGIPTSRDISEGNTTTAPTFDGLIEAKYSLKQQYIAKAAWIFHRDCIKILAKIKDEEKRYIWEQSVQAGQPDRLLGLPVYMSEYAPNTFTAGQYVGIIGDFSFYHIVDALDMQLVRLSEIYQVNNSIGYIARKETDGTPVMKSAFARVQLASGS